MPITRPCTHPITLLQALFPGALPDPLSEQETRQEKPAGALLSTEEVANYLAVSAEILRRLCRRKAITFIQVTPSEYRFDVNDLKEYIDSRRNRRKSVRLRRFQFLRKSGFAVPTFSEVWLLPGEQ